MDFKQSKTWQRRTPCGNLYIIVDYKDDGTFHKLRIARNSKDDFQCSLMHRRSIGKLATMGFRREPLATIKDLEGDKFSDKCDRYNITAKTTSCDDAVSQILKEVFKATPKGNG